ncbi:MAG TPA: DUF2520 domain-containing protein [Baekduia sp.]|nr:DUF2520 domain-containing protein [Baekduia sp.]
MTLSDLSIAVVGAGRLGTLLATSLNSSSPRGRGADCADADVILLCVPDDDIAAAAAQLQPRADALVGHCSGATTLAPMTQLGLTGFSLHPLMSVTHAGADLEGCWAAVAGSTDTALDCAISLAEQLGCRPFVVADDDRAAYHASASIASNFLVTLEWAAEQLGTDRRALLPLVQATVENWAQHGPQQALTGPIARGDEHTVERQREAIAERTPHLLELFDALTAATRLLADESRAAR